jgi:ATP-dependent protease ClpP protease subunit
MFKIVISGVIGWEVEPAMIREQLAAAKGQDLDIFLASPGGSVFAGIDIYNQLSDYKRKYPDAQIMAKGSGVIASMGAYLIMNPSIDMVVVEDNAAFMIHNAYSFSIGDHHQLRKDADMLEGLSSPIVRLVMQKMGVDQAKAEELMKEETWFFGQQIVDNGFAQEVVERPQGGKDRDSESAMAEIKAAEARYVQHGFAERAAAAIKPANSSIESNKSNQIKEDDEMTKEEIAELKAQVKAETLEAERGRVSEIHALKEKYKDTPAGSLVAGIVDEAIIKGESKSEVILSLNLAATNGNTQAALESPGATPQGFANTGSGEQKFEDGGL